MPVKTLVSILWLNTVLLTLCVPVSADDKHSSPQAPGCKSAGRSSARCRTGLPSSGTP